MSHWTNDWAIAINQDALGLGAIRVDGANASEPLVAEKEMTVYNQMKLEECGGEPADQKWTFDKPMAGFIFNPATKQCLNVEGCGSKVIYDACTTSGKTCGPPGTGKFANERWSITASGQLVSALATTHCATVQRDKTVTLTKCETPVPENQK
eukprot:SAG31_NODE_2117_length_6412_cov_7.762712_5_plen_153_part_00